MVTNSYMHLQVIRRAYQVAGQKTASHCSRGNQSKTKPMIQYQVIVYERVGNGISPSECFSWAQPCLHRQQRQPPNRKSHAHTHTHSKLKTVPSRTVTAALG